MEKIVETVPADRVREYDTVSAYFGDKKVCMFDIETTGLSPFSSFTYIIGLNVIEDGSWKIIQLFNDDGRSEPELIRTFQSMIKDYDVLVEFNGDNFDIPYIRKRMNFIQQKFGITLTDNFKCIEPFDLMKLVKPYKFALGLPNIKQKTIERYLGINRVDMYNGGQLIDVYLGYLAGKDDKSRELVLRHNRDDMEGMIFLSNILATQMMTEGQFKVLKLDTEMDNSKLMLSLEIELNGYLKNRIYTSMEGISLVAEDKSAKLKIPIYEGVMNYYPEKTKKEGCQSYEGYFVPSFGKTPEILAEYKEKPNTKETYVMLNDTFLGNNDYLRKYAGIIIDSVLRYTVKKK